ncbi:DUF3309 family protein [Pedobacter petrophilus]|uniref:DUF3309 family protein n=1 Tax=Pedobacter petrophilus TaxID=1908241 RepID=A0A7K0G218_9SPHI|nr:DUF3309 family protein [Pedobacter petrophilus]
MLNQVQEDDSSWPHGRSLGKAPSGVLGLILQRHNWLFLGG